MRRIAFDNIYEIGSLYCANSKRRGQRYFLSGEKFNQRHYSNDLYRGAIAERFPPCEHRRNRRFSSMGIIIFGDLYFENKKNEISGRFTGKFDWRPYNFYYVWCTRKSRDWNYYLIQRSTRERVNSRISPKTSSIIKMLMYGLQKNNKYIHQSEFFVDLAIDCS